MRNIFFGEEINDSFKVHIDWLSFLEKKNKNERKIDKN